MAKKSIPGLLKRGGIWHIDKKIAGYGRLRCSTGTSDHAEAETFLIYRLEEIRKQVVYGARSYPTFRQAATRYLNEYAGQTSAWLSATYLDQLVEYIGDMPINEIKHSSFDRYIEDRRNIVRNRTINIALQRAVRVLNLCARKWRDSHNRPWLDSVPMIEMLDEKKAARKPYPLDWKEQDILFSELAPHLRAMAVFKVNTGCREQEVCKLQWDWEIPVPELGVSVFLIPADFGGRFESSGVKNGEDRLVILNSIAKSIVSAQRGKNPVWVFPYNDGPLDRMNASGWRAARRRAADKWEKLYKRPADAGFRSVRVHDLKHTFGRRLRAAGTHWEDRQVLLGHTNGSVTTHYSAADLSKLLAEVEKLAHKSEEAPVVTLLRRRGER